MLYKQEVRRMMPVEVEPAELMTLTAAAGRLGLSPSAVADLMLRGVLRRVVDPGEPNPRKANRVFVADVEAELARRKVRRKAGDSRLRGRVR